MPRLIKTDPHHQGNLTIATTINAYSVGLTLDAADYITKSKLSARETRALSRDINAARTPAENYTRQQERLTKALNEGAIDQTVYNRLLEKAADKHAKAGKAATGNAQATETLTSKLTATATAMGPIAAAAVAFAAVGKGIGIAVDATEKFLSKMRESQKAIDVTAKAATKLGLSYNELTSLQFAAGQISGMDGDQVADAVKELQIKLAKAVDGDQTAQRAFARLGVDAAEAMQQGPLEAIEAISKGYESVNSQAERLNLANEIFGESGTRMVALLDGGSEALAAAVAKHEKYNGLTDAAVLAVEANNDAWDDVATKVDGITNRMAAEMAPAMQMVADELLAITKDADSFDKSMRMVTDTTVAYAAQLYDIYELIETLANPFSSNSIGDAFTFDSSQKALDELYKRREELEKQADQKAAEREAERHRRSQRQQQQTDKATKQADDKQADRSAKLADQKARELERLQRQADDAFTKQAAAAITAANKEFDERRKLRAKLRQDIAAGPGSGIEVGSADAAKYFADQTNARIGATVMPDLPTPGEQAIVTEAQRQFAEQQRQTKQQADQTRLLKEQLAVAKENGFRRWR